MSTAGTNRQQRGNDLAQSQESSRRQTCKSKSFIDVFKDHNEKLHQLINKDFAKRTHERYETALRLTNLFLQAKYKTEDIDIQDLN
jgi:hypothetical protein